VRWKNDRANNSQSKDPFRQTSVAGSRVTVQSVLELVNDGLSFKEIIQGYYPELTIEDIHACLQYAIALVAAEDIHLRSVAT